MNKPTLRHMFLSLLARIPVAASQAGAPPRIVLIRPDHLGDLLFMTPALHALRAARPDAHIACLVGAWGEPILRDNPDLDELLTCDFPWFNRRRKASAWEPYIVLWRAARRLRAQRFDIAYIMRFDFWWGAALARLAGIPQRVGYALPDVQPFLTHAIPYTPGLHEVEQNARLIACGPHLTPLPPSPLRSLFDGRGEGELPSPEVGRVAGIAGQPPGVAGVAGDERLLPSPDVGRGVGGEGQLSSPDLARAAGGAGPPPSPDIGRGAGGEGQQWREGPLRFTITAADAAWAAQRLGDPAPQTLNSEPRPFIAVHPGAGAAVKLWQVDGWVRVISELAQQRQATIVLTGGASELPLAQSVASRLTAPHIVLAGETNLGQLAAVFVRCRLVLGADSGPLHLAVAVGTPTVHLFGPIDPALFGPWGDAARHIVVQARFFDQPCHNRPCNQLEYTASELAQHGCMQTITVEDVLAAAQRARFWDQRSEVSMDFGPLSETSPRSAPRS